MMNILWNAYLFEKPSSTYVYKSDLQTFAYCEYLEGGERVAGTIPPSYACILAWGRGWSVRFISCDFLLI